MKFNSELSLKYRSDPNYLLAGLFFVSGACGLIYEVAWTRMFAVVAGGTTKALTAVLVAYMAGLALGSLLGGRYVDRKAGRPILIYGLLEGGVGILAILLPFLIPALLPVLKAGRTLLPPDSLGFELYRFLILALTMILPTTLMGATFPVLLRGLLSRRERFGLTAGLLYGLNSLGAMAGAFCSGFVFIPALGLRATVFLGAGFNLLILALILALPALREPRAEKRALEIKPVAGEGPGPGRFALLLGGYGLSGLCAMVYQVGWARVLALALSNSTYALALILTAYIGGLALGGLVMTPVVDRLKRPLLWAAGLEVLIGLSALAVIPLFEWVTGRMFLWSLSLFHRFTAYQAVRFAVAFGLILLPTFAMGALFPLLVKMAGSGHRGVGEPAGEVYAANTLGAVVGAFLTGQALIGWLGVEKTLLLATGLSVAVGLAWLLWSESPLRLRLPVAGGLAALAALAIGRVPAWDPLLMNSGPFLYSQYYEKQLRQGVSVRDILNDTRLLFYQEGLEATVSVLEARDTAEKILRINGKADATSRQDMPTEILLAHVPLLLHPHPKKVMVLGLASGVSAGSALLYPVEQVDCLEISPEVAAASHYFEAVSRLDYRDPRFHLILDDARNFLAMTDARYDVITIESTNPWIAGIGTLFTREFFQLLADHLDPGGMALIFIPVYDMDPDTVRMVLRTYRSVFPYTTLWESIPAVDYLVVGSRQPIQVDWSQWQARASAPAVAQDLARVGFHGPDLVAAFVMGSERLAQAAGVGPLDTDDRRRLEFVLPRLMATPPPPRQAAIIREILSQHEPASVIVSGADREWTARLAGFDRARALYYQALAMSSGENFDEADLQRIIQAWEDAHQADGDSYLAGFAGRELAAPLMERGNLRLSKGYAAGAVADWDAAFRLNPYDYAATDQLLDYYQDQEDPEKVRDWAEKALQVGPRDTYALEVLGQMEQDANHLTAAEKLFREALEVSPQVAKFRWNLAVVLAMQNKLFQAEQEFRTLLETDPQNPDYLLALAYALKDQGRRKEADRYLEQARKIAPDHPLFQKK